MVGRREPTLTSEKGKFMKFALALVLGLMGSSAFATVSASDSWATIMNTKGVIVNQGNYASLFGNKGFFNACVSKKSLRSIKPVTTCVLSHEERTGGANEGTDMTVCDSYQAKTISIPLTQTVLKCVEVSTGGGQESGGSTCDHYVHVTVSIPTKMNFAVWAVVRDHGGQEGMEDQNDFLFTKGYQIPSCK
jgi:hypothetical protein